VITEGTQKKIWARWDLNPCPSFLTGAEYTLMEFAGVRLNGIEFESDRKLSTRTVSQLKLYSYHSRRPRTETSIITR